MGSLHPFLAKDTVGILTVHLSAFSDRRLHPTGTTKHITVVALAAKHPEALKLVELDITSQESVDKAVAAATPLLPNGLDYLVNKAGKNPQPLTKFEDLYVHAFLATKF